MKGFVYIMSNPSMPGLLKIGQTATDPEGRRRELQDTGVPLPFELEYSIYIEDYESVERAVHQRLGDFRAASNREFFQLPLDQAVGVIKSVCEGTEFVVVANDQESIFARQRWLNCLVTVFFGWAIPRDLITGEEKSAFNRWKWAYFVYPLTLVLSLISEEGHSLPILLYMFAFASLPVLMAFVAEKYGRSPHRWYWAGIFTFGCALVVLLVLGERKSTDMSERD